MDDGGRAPGRRKLLGECAAPALIGAAAAAVVAVLLARRQVLFGQFGDAEQLIWQTKNLVAMLSSGDAFVRDSFFGLEIPYAYMPTSFGEGALIAVIRAVTGNVWFAYNLLLFLGLVANFVSMYCCCRIGGASTRAAGIGAWVFMLAPQTMAQAIAGHMWFAWTFLIPPFFLLIARAGRDASGRWWWITAIVTSTFVWIHEYLWMFATTVAVVAAIVTLLRRRALPWRNLVLALVAGIVITAPFVATQLERLAFDRVHDTYSGRGIPVAVRYSSLPSHYIQPSNASVLYIDVPDPIAREFDLETLNYLGLIPLGAAAASTLRPVRRRMNPALKRLLARSSPIAMAAFLLSLGLHLGFGDPASNPIGMLYTRDVFPFTEVSAWARFGIFAFAWFALLTAAVIDALWPSIPRLWATVLLLLVGLLIAVDQYPYFDALKHRAPAPREMIAAIQASPPTARVVHIPLDPAGNVRYNAMAQFLQTFHGHPIVNGYTSVIPPRYFEDLSDDPIGCLQTLSSAPCRETTAIGESIRSSDIGWVVVDGFQANVTMFVAEHPVRVASGLERVAEVVTELEQQGVLVREYADDDYELYRVAG